MRENTKNFFLSIGIIATELLLLKLEYVFIAFSILFVYSLYKLYPERHLLIKITKSAYTLKFYNVVIWFFSYLLTLKILSVLYDIDEEYLKYSPALVTIPVSICVSYFFLVFFTSLASMLGIIASNVIGFLPKWVKNKYDQSTFVKFVSMLQSLMIVMVIPFFLAALCSVYFARIAIFSDASFLSDCGAKQWRVMYLRKNNNECYKFILNRDIFSEKPVIVKSKK